MTRNLFVKLSRINSFQNQCSFYLIGYTDNNFTVTETQAVVIITSTAAYPFGVGTYLNVEDNSP